MPYNTDPLRGLTNPYPDAPAPPTIMAVPAENQAQWIQEAYTSLSSFPTQVLSINHTITDPVRPHLIRLLLNAAMATVMNDTQVVNAIRDIRPLNTGPVAAIVAAANDNDSEDDETPDDDDVFRIMTTGRLSKMEDAIARIEGLMKKTLDNKKDTNPKGKGKETTTQTPGPAAPGGSKATQPAQTLTPPDEKVRDPLARGELLFAPDTAVNKAQIIAFDGQQAINTINKALTALTPECSVKGFRWTPKNNALLTPAVAEEWDILAKHGAKVLQAELGVPFTLRTSAPTKDLVVHGWPAKHGALPNAKDICLKISSSLKLNGDDLVPESSRWLIGPKSNTSRPPLLLLAVTTEEAEGKLLFSNPHYIEGKKITFKKFRSPATVPNQCNRCWKVGHPTWRCSTKVEVCALCATPHATKDHTCPNKDCKGRGMKCPHFPFQCPTCAQEHPAWDRDCVKRQIQRATNPPKKKPTPPKAKDAPADSPVRKAANLIRAIPKGSPGAPVRDISKLSDLDLTKKFRLWALYNGLPVIVTDANGQVSWGGVPAGATLTTPFLPHLEPAPNGS
ncbi:hypothetical protein BOTBODRAFT_180722 [Botryobasidium botryosum FD-172 SS1]|uniref:Uncharacterized protein n=1 Tax=Botryobasidium botryosum (strain FD-172 SS1) TaxID=930990 RepID=A0A067LWA0_BOTB1|nr:hypothetical protein BOTBODRAFT_180722 [Botryobasidium botryosum FD-172 SS1]